MCLAALTAEAVTRAGAECDTGPLFGSSIQQSDRIVTPGCDRGPKIHAVVAGSLPGVASVQANKIAGQNSQYADTGDAGQGSSVLQPDVAREQRRFWRASARTDGRAAVDITVMDLAGTVSSSTPS
jgi:hypothetical protein